MQFSFQFPPAEDAPAQARAALEVFDQILSPDVLEDLQLVVSELVTNSVKFGPKRPITLALSIGGDGIVAGEVIDQGDGREAKVEMTVEPTLDRRLGPAPRRPGRPALGRPRGLHPRLVRNRPQPPPPDLERQTAGRPGPPL